MVIISAEAQAGEDSRTWDAVRNDQPVLDWESWLAQPWELRDEWQPGEPAMYLPGVRKVTDLYGGISPDEIMMRTCQKWEKVAAR